MFEQTYTYEDIGLVPTKCSEIPSRDDVNPSIEFADYKLSLPIVLAPMEKAVGHKMVDAINKLGGLCCLPRDFPLGPFDKRFIYSTSTRIFYQIISKYNCILIDTANGFHNSVRQTIKEIQKEYPNIKIIAGNVGSVEGFNFLADLGIYGVRVGVGNGSVCSTSIATGIGQGQASLVREIALSKDYYKYKTLLIADGGIKTPGDVCKAIALGADIVMTGRVFAGCEESPGPVIKFNGELYKSYAGQASHAVKKSDKYIEGDDTIVPYCGTAEKVWIRFEDGIRSCMSYMNCKTVEELKFLPSSNFRLLSSASKMERGVHANM